MLTHLANTTESAFSLKALLYRVLLRMTGYKTYSGVPHTIEPIPEAERGKLKKSSNKVIFFTGIYTLISGSIGYVSAGITLKAAYGKYAELNVASGWLYITFGTLFTSAILISVLYAFLKLQRAVIKRNLKNKIIYKGTITHKRQIRRGAKMGSLVCYATLDGVEFSIKKEDCEKLSMGNTAFFHCSFPGDVFLVTPSGEKAGKKTNGLPIFANTSPENPEVAEKWIVPVLIMTGIFFISTFFTVVSAGIWWYSGKPPVSLLFNAESLVMEISESRIQLVKKRADQQYETLVQVSHPILQNIKSEDDPLPPIAKFHLEGRLDQGKVYSREAALSALKKYPLGKKLVVFTRNKIHGPFFIARYSLKSIVGATAIITVFLGINAIAVYLLFFRIHERK